LHKQLHLLALVVLLTSAVSKTIKIPMGDYYVFHKTVKSASVVHYRFSPKNGDFLSRRNVFSLLSGLDHNLVLFGHLFSYHGHWLIFFDPECPLALSCSAEPMN
jgi:hypothetical protein